MPTADDFVGHLGLFAHQRVEGRVATSCGSGVTHSGHRAEG